MPFALLPCIRVHPKVPAMVVGSLFRGILSRTSMSRIGSGSQNGLRSFKFPLERIGSPFWTLPHPRLLSTTPPVADTVASVSKAKGIATPAPSFDAASTVDVAQPKKKSSVRRAGGGASQISMDDEPQLDTLQAVRRI
jgi:hypothetical protein